MQKNNQQDQMVSGSLMQAKASVVSQTEGQPGLSHELSQSLSAMMDDEAEQLEVRRVVKAAATDRELTAKWSRYHVVRASIRQEIHQRPAVDMLTAIQGRLSAEPPVVGKFSQRWGGGRVLRLAGQGAIAATVAAVVLLGSSLQTAPDGQSNTATVAVATNNSPQQSLPALSGDFSASPLTRTVSMDDAARDRLAQAVRNYSGTSAVLNTATTPMFKSQLEPFSIAQPAVAPSTNSNRR